MTLVYQLHPAHHEVFLAKVGKGGLNFLNILPQYTVNINLTLWQPCFVTDQKTYEQSSEGVMQGPIIPIHIQIRHFVF